MNLTTGGLLGYCSSNCKMSRKVPSSNGVSEGPIITAFHFMTLSGNGDAETPLGGSCCMRWEELVEDNKMVSLVAYTYFKISHESSFSWSRHSGLMVVGLG